jgi:thiol peroxidase
VRRRASASLRLETTEIDLMTKRSGAVTFKGTPMTLMGPEIRVGDEAPHFKLVGNDLADIECKLFHGKVRVLSVAPSIDTPVCATQTRTFNKEAAGLSEDVVVLSVSLDLPFALKRFCGAEGIERVITASDYKYRDFGEAYGVLISELGLLTRAVFVVNRENKVTHAEYVAEVTSEPDYAAALKAVEAAV